MLHVLSQYNNECWSKIGKRSGNQQFLRVSRDVYLCPLLVFSHCFTYSDCNSYTIRSISGLMKEMKMAHPEFQTYDICGKCNGNCSPYLVIHKIFVTLPCA